MAIDFGYALYAPVAAFNLGLILQKQGDLDGTIAAYRQAAGSGHAHYGPVAAVNLGLLLAGRGDVAGARAAYQQAIDSGHPDHLPRAAINLGLLHKRLREYPSARAAFRRAITSGHPDCAHPAGHLDVILAPNATCHPVVRPCIVHESRRIRREAGWTWTSASRPPTSYLT